MRAVVGGGGVLASLEGQEPTAFLILNDLFKPEFLSGFLESDSRMISLNLVTQFHLVYGTQK